VAEDRRLVARLTAADRSLREERLPPRAVRRIANRIAQEIERPTRARRLGWIPMLTFVAGAALVLMFVAWANSGEDTAPPEVASRPATDAWARISGPDCHHRELDGDALEISGACEAVTLEPAMRIQTVAEAALGLERRRVRLQRGSALFDVDPVVGDPVRIVVPGGEIVVIGTRFRVVIHDRGGQVDLYEGRLEFHADDGTTTPIVAGQQFAFGTRRTATRKEPTRDATPREPEPAAIASPRKIKRPPVATEPPPAEPSAAQIIEAVQQLRRRGEYERAASRLREALGQRWPTRTADVLSYELGTILARHLHDRDHACTHWRRHLERFGATRYRRQVLDSIATLDCS
jgi:hypothetical protein